MTGRYTIFRLTLGQIAQILRPLPPVALVPFAILWFKLGEASKYFLVFWGVFFPVWLNTHLGILAVDKHYLWAAQSMGAKGKTILFEILLPAASPAIVAGLRVAIGIAFYCLIAAEIAGAFSGVAYRIAISHLTFRVDRMVANLIVLGLMSVVVDRSLTWLLFKLMPWTKADQSNGEEK